MGLLLVGIMIVTSFISLVNINTAEAASSPADSAVQFLYNDYADKGINNSDAGVGSYALYVLTQAGVDVSTWMYTGVCLKDAVINAANDDISNASDPSIVSAKLLGQDLAAMKALGQSDLAVQIEQILQHRQSSTGFDTGDYSIFSNLAAYDLLGRADSISVINTVYAKDYILGTQNQTIGDPAYGSWGCTWENNYYADFMATAAAVRALNYLDPNKSDVLIQDAINNGLNWMKDQQQADGSFLAGMDDPTIDTSEVIVTLKTCGMDPAAWKSSGGKSAVDYLMNNALNDDGSFGTSGNAMCATWALCAYNSLDEHTVWRLYLDPSSTTLNVGGTVQLSAFWQNADGTADVSLDAQWSAADSSIVSVDSSGLVTALRAGQTEVYAVYGGLTASASVTVNSGVGGTAKTVGLAVVGMNGELLYGPSNHVRVAETNRWGFTVLGALDASGIDYHTSTWAWGILVDSIGGQANSGMAGWMYAVNGQIASTSPENCSINDRDKIIWYYSTSMDQEPPNWNDLVSGNIIVVQLPDPVSDTALNTAIQKARSTGLVALMADKAQNLLALSNEQLTKILNTGKPLAVTVQGVQFILSPDSLKVPEIMAASTAQLQLTVQKVSSGDAQNLVEPFADKFKLAGDVYELNVLVVNKKGKQISIEQFPDCKVLLPVPESLREAAAAGEVMAYRYNENSKVWEKVVGTYDTTSGIISFKTEHFSKYALLETVSPPEEKNNFEEKITFKDITGHWAQKEIEFMAAKGYMAGIGDNKFAVEATVTRAEFAAILARMAGLTANPGGTDLFSDVPAGAWYRGAVGAVVSAGLVYGTSENSFAPDDPITREQMAAMIARYMVKNGLDLTISDADAVQLLAGFSDAADVFPWARTSVALMTRERLMAGRESGQFVPKGNTTRAEAAVVLYRVLQKLPQLGK